MNAPTGLIDQVVGIGRQRLAEERAELIVRKEAILTRLRHVKTLVPTVGVVDRTSEDPVAQVRTLLRDALALLNSIEGTDG